VRFRTFMSWDHTSNPASLPVTYRLFKHLCAFTLYDTMGTFLVVGNCMVDLPTTNCKSGSQTIVDWRTLSKGIVEYQRG